MPRVYSSVALSAEPRAARRGEPYDQRFGDLTVRISAKGEYAIQAVLDLALHRQRGLTPIQEIAARQAIPQRYLEQVLLALKRSGLLTSKRGSAGGYHLTRPPEDITVRAVLSAGEG